MAMPTPFSTAWRIATTLLTESTGCARVAGLAAGRAEPVHVLQIGRRVLAEDDDAVLVDVVGRLRLAEALDVGGRGVDVEMHGEELALDQVGLRRRAQPDRDVGLAHGDVELANRRG